LQLDIWWLPELRGRSKASTIAPNFSKLQSFTREQHNASAITKAGNWSTSKINCLTESANMSLLFHIRIFATSYPSQTPSITQAPAPSISTSTAIDFSKRIDWR
jgi:hypothetical protein